MPKTLLAAIMLVVVTLLLLLIPSAPARAAINAAERWAGVVELPGFELEFTVTFTADGAATIDIPIQGVAAAPLEDVALEPGRIVFALAPEGAPFKALFELDRDPDAAEARGQISQAGQTFPVTMRRLDDPAEVVGPRRPQHPKRPFPYEEREVEIQNHAGAVTLAGTLTIPASRGPHPAVIFITGSGPQDRDETIFGHKPFLVISDHLTRRGVATLRLDDRGVGGSTGSVADSTSADFVGDVLTGIEFLKSLPEIDGRRVGLIGHSEGAIVAPMAVTESDDIAFIVLLAGTGLPGRDILSMQLADITRTTGVGEESIERRIRFQQRTFDHLIAGDEEAMRASLRELVLEQSGGAMSDEQVEQYVSNGAEQLQSAWFRSFVELDPRDYLRRVRIPVLALNGSLDLQVPAKANLTAIREALREAGNRDVTVIELEGLNHLFQTARTGSPEEYASIEETFSPRALEIIAEWVAEQTH